MPPSLAATLAGAAGLLRDAHEPWWIITGAAVALHGGESEVGDVDILVGVADARRLLGAQVPGPPSGRYRSALFGRIDGWPLPIEVMADFELRVGDEWRPVRFATREAVTVAGDTLFVPAREELAALLRLLGRPKDMRRVAVLMA